jgi:tetratricopeptide (TPR) repeat protein
MERTILVILALATIAPAAEPGSLDIADRKTPCHQTQSAAECAVAVNNLGSVYFASGKYREAESLFTRALSLWTAQAAGADDVAKALHNLGAVYREEGRYADATRFLLQALEVRQLLVDPDAVALLPILNDLGLAYLDMADYSPAEETLKRALAIVQAHQAGETESGADAFAAWGVLLETEGKNAEAIQCLSKALATRDHLAGRDSVAAADAANDLALAYKQQSDLTTAESLYRRALAIYRKSGNPGSLVTVLNNLGLTLAEQTQYKEAEQLYREAIQVAQRQLGPAHVDVAVGLGNLAKLMIARRKFSDAEPLLARAEQIDRENFSPEHPRIGFDLHNEAVVAVGRKHYAEAESLYRKSDAIPELGKVVAGLANIYRLEGRLDESESLYRRALQILDRAWGPTDPRLFNVLESYEAVLRARQDYAEAESVQVRSTKIRVGEALRDSN